MFEKALELNSKLENPPPSSSWDFAIGLAYSAANAHNDAQAKYKKVLKSADEAWKKGDSSEYKHLASVVHTLPACPVVDHRMTDRTLLALALRKNNATEAAIGKVHLLPEEMEEMEEFEEEEGGGEEVRIGEKYMNMTVSHRFASRRKKTKSGTSTVMKMTIEKKKMVVHPPAGL